MLIDGFTIIAQLINFIILVFLLQRFLYQPILKTIRARQTEIEDRWQAAEEKQAAAQSEASFYQHKQQELEQRQQEVMAEAEAKAEQKYQNLVQQARREVDNKQAKWEAAIMQQQEHLFEEFQQKITENIYQIVRHIFQDLANIQLEQQVMTTFIHRLENLDEKQRQSLAESLKSSEEGLIVRSGFELPAESRDRMINVLKQQQIYPDNPVQFTTQPDLICGIEIQASNYKIAWNLQSYLQSLEQHIAHENQPKLNSQASAVNRQS